MKNTHKLLCCALTFALLPAMAMAASVTDGGQFFSADTLTKANAEIDRLENKYRKDVKIETFAGIPDDKKAAFDSAGKVKFFQQWFQERARALNVKGIFVLICKNPAHLEVGASKSAYDAGYSINDRDQLRNVLLENFKAKRYDEGLNAAVNLISTQYDEMARMRPTTAGSPPRGGTVPPATGSRSGGGASSGSANAPSIGDWGWTTWLLVIGGGYLLLRLLSGLFRRPAPSGGPNYGPPQGPGYGGGYPPGGGMGGGMGGSGGGFFSSMLGGLFGGAAGNWAANRWFNTSQQNPNAPPSNGLPGDYRSGGGDFGPGDTGGGGDFGGGSGGGGGDFGGGGGDSGGGGGSSGGDF